MVLLSLRVLKFIIFNHHRVNILILYELIINISDIKSECDSMNCSATFECLRKPHGVMCVCPKGMHYSNNKCSGKT